MKTLAFPWLLAAFAVSTPAPLPRFVVADEPAWSRDGRRIAFVAAQTASRDAPRALYTINADGSGLRRLTVDGFAARWPSWSPDGRRIVFEHESDLYVVGAGGGGLRRLVAGGSYPAWGPGGARIAFSRETPLGNDRIHLVSVDGSGDTVIADSHDECETYIEPSWSPDGERLAFLATGAGGECGFNNFIGVTRGEGERVRVLAGGWFAEPDWSPDGRSLAMVSSPPDNGFLTTVSTFDLRRQWVRHLRRGSHPRWSPDGRRLVFVRGTDAHSRLYVMNADGSHLEPLTR